MKNKCEGRFGKFHTWDGNIKAQLSNAQADDDNWVTIKNPDNLFKHCGFVANLDVLNVNYKRFEVYPIIDKTAMYNKFEERLADVDDHT